MSKHSILGEVELIDVKRWGRLRYHPPQRKPRIGNASYTSEVTCPVSWLH